MASTKIFNDASHALNKLSKSLALLESENASLRGAVDGLCDSNDRYKAENAKLRELVGKILNESHIDKSCAECDMRDECAGQRGRWMNCLFVERVEEEARRLGIEVD